MSKKESGVARDAARSGRYQLLLGAGASVGAVNSFGPLPLASGLVEILAEEYPSAPINSKGTLTRAYQRAVKVSSTEHVWGTLKRIFSGASHDPWFVEMTQLPWRRVWTLNIDDAFENSYRSRAGKSDRKLSIIDWQDAYSDTGDLQVVHLHGHVHGLNPSKLVFSFSEYQTAAQAHPVWDQVLSGVVGSEPFVVIGAKMLEDPDIEALLMNNPPRGLAPSFVVDPCISSDNKWELEGLGFRVVKEMPYDFIDAWRSSFGLTEGELHALRQSHALSIPQFSKLQTNVFNPPPSGHDYFGGDAPLWSDAVVGHIAGLDWMASVVSGVRSWALEAEGSEKDQTLHIVYGERLTGTSSGLYAVAREATKMHVDPYIFDKSSRWDVELMVDLARQRPTLLLLDGGRDFADDVDRTLKLAVDAGARLYIVVSETFSNVLRLEGRLTGSYFKDVTNVPNRLVRAGASSVVKVLEKFGRLGSLELKDRGERQKNFMGRDIFSSMMDVEYSLGFRRRLENELNAVDVGWRLDLILLLGLAAQVNRPVGLVDASVALGISADLVGSAVDSEEHFSALVESVEGRLLARQRDRAIEPVINKLGRSVALSKVLGFIQRLAPMASRASLQKRNRVPLLVAHLMTGKNLQKTFPGEDLDSFYEALRPVFGDWNGRYWEQRAIYAKSKLDWARAESFAGRSVSLYEDAYTRTTYGTILINRAENLAAIQDQAWRSYYERGQRELDLAQSLEPGSRVTAFAYLNSTLALLEKLLLYPRGEGDDFSSVSADWTQRYAVLRLSLTGEQHLQSVSRAEDLSQKWEGVRLKGLVR
ncbi:SIR2 family protein [Micromonospora sp. RL09-050-HVF-A]|uniref:SIR2 family protein n=1 Tax=Micromonospora sp. RL09-050-HVF-A TaxID=1703433 RepID=UPI001C5FFD6E|nr:SIR2 family protein [Micromonospora sp. RL09-050-HVF-A]MBW4702424.1 SIR2 family protein [Micromonospora sp. RL09-050-HVF-A]